jgi:ectoine hydroxylase-related dioxygenase (phytanoyl-CoA dioxygenase family)
MRLASNQLQFYEENGYLLLPECFSEHEVDILKTGLDSEIAEDSERRVLENCSGNIRSVYGVHIFNKVFNRLSRHPRLVRPAMAILGNKVYVYQSKINVKARFGGDVWQWHQDYIFWLKEDRLPTDRITTIAIFLNDVTQFNAPLYLIPGSHREGVIDVEARKQATNDIYRQKPIWISNLTADLKYALDNEVISNLIQRYGIVSAEGSSGSILFFHGNLVHGSTNNISPFDRLLALISYSSIDNVPQSMENPRPEFLASRNCEPIVPLGDDALLI